jgi:ATP-grasp domain, R2K clade family 3
MSKYEREFAKRHFQIEESRMLCKGRLVVGRYSVLPFYDELDRDLRLVGSQMVNTLDEHQWISSFDYYQEVKGFTPETWTEDTIYMCQHDGPFVVKGKRSSKKWQWKSQMFAETKSDALTLGERLKEDSEISEQGIVYRRYVPLRTFEIGHNGLPYTNEWRFFFYRTSLLSVGYYWSVGDCFRQASIGAEGMQMAERIARIVSKFTAFYTLDLAETENGDWLLIEINDGQMAMPSEHNLDGLYGKLKEAIA